MDKKSEKKKAKAQRSPALARLRLDYLNLKADPLPYIYAEPEPSNLLQWHYILRGPSETPFHGGFYHGKIVFTESFPFRPPAIYMFTPSGRFKPNTRLCLSISDYHPELWNPTWCVGTILQGVLSFMLDTAPTVGALVTTNNDKKDLAFRSLEYNLKQKIIRELFPELVAEMKSTVEYRKIQKAVEIARNLKNIAK